MGADSYKACVLSPVVFGPAKFVKVLLFIISGLNRRQVDGARYLREGADFAPA